jgi:hypothetical protein
MTRIEARLLAVKYVEAIERESGINLILLDDITSERAFGWVFFYDSKRHQETGDFSDVIAGNAPIVVTRVDGRLHVTGTAFPVEHYLKPFDHYEPSDPGQ